MRDRDGARRYGPRGEPLTIAEWVEGLRSEATHWWPQPATPGAVRESAPDIERMSPREKMEAAMAGVCGKPR